MRCSTCGGEVDSSGACADCSTIVQERPVSIPGYRTLSLLGHGGMGAVWLGEDVALERKVAIKVISERDADPDSQTRFVREARALASVDHPNVIRVHTYGVVD